MKKGALSQRTIIGLIIVLFIFIMVAVAVTNIFKDILGTEISEKGEPTTTSVEGAPIECVKDEDCPLDKQGLHLKCENGICVGEAEYVETPYYITSQEEP